jgi:phosphatidylinositol 4-kinase
MMDSAGRLVHIDFGFLLSNAPGGSWVRFEAAPMKLSREFLEVMDSDSEGQPSELFDYFKVRLQHCCCTPNSFHYIFC